MKLSLWTIIIGSAVLFSSSPDLRAQSVALTGPHRVGMTEDHTYDVEWNSNGLQSVSVLAYGDRTPMGNKSRGDFRIAIAEAVPAERGSVQWKVPWIDAKTFTVKIKGYDSSGHVVATDTKAYDFRPEVLANRLADGIYLDLSRRVKQRLYVQRDKNITRVYFTTSSQNYNWKPRGSHPKAPHDHAGVFQVLEKDPNHWSTLYDVPMRWAMRYYSGHYVHATSTNLYDELGGPASHGCNRMTRKDAHELYRMTPIGYRVEVIGPGG
ncbi:MAG: L,D-transpeptidase [Armatimonadetes bacterium]|nr:L,D-transpeptidase [Armatimonadota bacterium]